MSPFRCTRIRMTLDNIQLDELQSPHRWLLQDTTLTSRRRPRSGNTNVKWSSALASGFLKLKSPKLKLIQDNANDSASGSSLRSMRSYLGIAYRVTGWETPDAPLYRLWLINLCYYRWLTVPAWELDRHRLLPPQHLATLRLRRRLFILWNLVPIFLCLFFLPRSTLRLCSCQQEQRDLNVSRRRLTPPCGVLSVFARGACRCYECSGCRPLSLSHLRPCSFRALRGHGHAGHAGMLCARASPGYGNGRKFWGSSPRHLVALSYFCKPLHFCA